ncbi:hypothetical protein C2G38_2226425 [Gigaspora rosea]|uniref:Uncharacterized protein n=1 Tax=Gigaspora rosea TaxID=44941 RepID=A0A397U1L8_9GLOM|nr:hypothetical protein C2G38_2226425 [Gigaspora rosea]
MWAASPPCFDIDIRDFKRFKLDILYVFDIMILSFFGFITYILLFIARYCLLIFDISEILNANLIIRDYVYEIALIYIAYVIKIYYRESKKI